MKKYFDKCEICGSVDWQIVYAGKIRDGAFGNLSESDCMIGKCSNCKVERLNEEACKDENFYRDKEYRRLLNEPEDAEGFLAELLILDVQQGVFWIMYHHLQTIKLL